MKMAGGFALAASAVTLIAAPGAGATTYNNDAPIILPEAGVANPSGLADPYPSSIAVSGTAGPITDVNVGFDGLTHSFPNDVVVALVAPSGQALLLMDCVGDDTDAPGVFLTLDDAAAAHLPNTGVLATGTFKPTGHCNGTIFTAPGPLSYGHPGPSGGNTATFATAFNGQSAIGTWKLYVFSLDGSGSIPGGWSLDVHPDVTPLPPAPAPAPAKKCKKKKKKGKKATSAAKKGCKKKRKK